MYVEAIIVSGTLWLLSSRFVGCCMTNLGALMRCVVEDGSSEFPVLRSSVLELMLTLLAANTGGLSNTGITELTEPTEESAG